VLLHLLVHRFALLFMYVKNVLISMSLFRVSISTNVSSEGIREKVFLSRVNQHWETFEVEARCMGSFVWLRTIPLDTHKLTHTHSLSHTHTHTLSLSHTHTRVICCNKCFCICLVDEDGTNRFFRWAYMWENLCPWICRGLCPWGGDTSAIKANTLQY